MGLRQAIRRQHILGLDLGQSRDHSAIVAVERAEVAGEFNPVTYAFPKEAELRVTYLERVPLGTPYPEVARRVRDLALELDADYLAVDATGVGRPVVDLLSGCVKRMLPVVITGGMSEGMSRDYHTAPKKDLMAEVMVLLEGRELKIAKELEWSAALREELTGMRVRQRKSGYESMEGPHDDLVMALALACWAGRKVFGKALTGRSGWCVRDVVWGGVLGVLG